MDDSTRELIFQTIDNTISPEDFEKLQDLLERDEIVRTEYLKLVGLCDSLEQVAAEDGPSSPNNTDQIANRDRLPTQSKVFYLQLALASSLLLMLTSLVLLFGSNYRWNNKLRQANSSGLLSANRERLEPEKGESQIAGHATLRSTIDVVWAEQSPHFVEGDVIPDGRLAFLTGTIEIDFFSGANLIVEGPAELEVESDWTVRLVSGRIRAQVPPAARGFVVKAADASVIDLGTEFAMQVDEENAWVEVLDGEVKFQGGVHDGMHLFTGESESLVGASIGSDSSSELSTTAQLNQRRLVAERDKFNQWKSHSDSLADDSRLIAYYPISAGVDGRRIKNVSTQTSDGDGLLVGPVLQSQGRFGPTSRGLEFDRPGARVRTLIEGEFEALSFACWVRIDDLKHRYNALFMGDGYENGEPHWQIRDDGKMMFSIMVDDSQEIRHFSKFDQQMVTDAGLHRVYFTPPIWEINRSGQWFHLAAVYDPQQRRVQQYVNGEQVSSERIMEKFYIPKLKIGPAEIGNWGQPFRNTPWFAVRNLHGAIDELAIFDSPLRPEEIQEMYQQGKPVGY